MQHAGAGHDEHHHEEFEVHGTRHVVPLSVYYRVFAVLVVGLIITLCAAMFNLGPWNLVIAVAIAVIKVACIALYFMHLRWSSPMVRFFGGAALFWLLIMFSITLTDYMTRPWFGLPEARPPSVHAGP